ncbi:MAG: 5-(carboxyamino)imidazole ribonucleotide synthase [Cytophagales bacterium]|nr:5-(carboxyamino)imidazole ribonucleotide synthase [Armatimonadota bacterium]
MGRMIPPGSVIGILGGGQLGRMLAIAARQMGYHVHVLVPEADAPAAALADRVFVAPYEDLEAVRAFAAGVSVVTFEFENVPAATAEACAEQTLVRPGGGVLHTTQDRLREKTFLAQQGFPVTPFAPVRSEEELAVALTSLGLPAVLKTAGFGYDGKGQSVLRLPGEAAAAWAAVGGGPCILETFIAFECEISVVAARGADGSFAHFGAVRNEHRHHILDVTTAPAPGLAPDLAQKAVEITRGVLEALGVIGVLCVEFFVTGEGTLRINECAPRPHNSGHFTIDGCVTSQFEQQLRAVCGLPLGDTSRLRPGAAMANLLGDLWGDGEPDWAGMMADFPGVKLHLYGKSEARAGRKMGHLTVLGDNPAAAAAAVRQARDRLRTVRASV